MTLLCTFFVPGEAAPGGSKRHIGGGRMIDACKRNAPWRAVVALAARQHYHGEPVRVPLRLTIAFTISRPKGHYRTGKHAGQLRPDAPAYPCKKPDTTKLVRALEDALTGIVWHDDVYVVRQVASKDWTPDGEGPGARVTVEVMGT